MTDVKHVIALLYFVEEALGYRQSLHWLRRYLETSDKNDLQALIKEVCRENFLDDDLWSKAPTASLKSVRAWLEDKTTLLDLLENFDPLVATVSDYFNQKDWALERLKNAIDTYPDVNWVDALSRNQIRSKLWLIDRLQKQNWLDTEEIALVGGWLGMIPYLAKINGHTLGNIVNYDIDQTCHGPSKKLNRNLHQSFKNVNQDIRSVDFSNKSDVLIIDTIVEHFENHGDWIKTLPSGTRVVLQSNDMFGLSDHVNCHHDLEDFISSCGLGVIHWQGQLEQIGCTRFMLLGQV